MTTSTARGDSVAKSCNFTAGLSQRPTQLPLFSHGPTLWDRAHRAAAWQEIARALPANLGLEWSPDGWRIIVVPVATRRALAALDIAEGDVIPDPVILERRRRALEAELMLAQAQAVLRTVQAENETAVA